MTSQSTNQEKRVWQPVREGERYLFWVQSKQKYITVTCEELKDGNARINTPEGRELWVEAVNLEDTRGREKEMKQEAKPPVKLVGEVKPDNGSKNGSTPPVKEAIHHSTHYQQHPSKVECIEVVRHMNFNLGSAMKYLWRLDSKADPIEDLKKAIWYINDEIKRRTGAGFVVNFEDNKEAIQARVTELLERMEGITGDRYEVTAHKAKPQPETTQPNQGKRR